MAKNEVLYQRRPHWLVRGKGQRPDDYSGKIVCIRDHPPKPPWTTSDGPNKLRGVAILDLTEAEVADGWERKWKVSADGRGHEPVTFEDRWGAAAAELRASFPQAEQIEVAVEALGDEEPTWAQSEWLEHTERLRRELKPSAREDYERPKPEVREIR